MDLDGQFALLSCAMAHSGRPSTNAARSCSRVLLASGHSHLTLVLVLVFAAGGTVYSVSPHERSGEHQFNAPCPPAEG